MPRRKRKQVHEEESSDVAKKQDTKEPAKMTVAELRKELQTRGLDTNGKKAELVARLEEALKGSGEDNTGMPPRAKKTKTESAGDIIEFATFVHYTHSILAS